MVDMAKTCTLSHCLEEPADSAPLKGWSGFAADAIGVEICHSKNLSQKADRLVEEPIDVDPATFIKIKRSGTTAVLQWN
jgi:hypothetical protein